MPFAVWGGSPMGPQVVAVHSYADVVCIKLGGKGPAPPGTFHRVLLLLGWDTRYSESVAARHILMHSDSS